MECVQTLNDAIEYMEDHLCEEIQCEDVANAENLEMIPEGFEELTIPAYTWVIFKSIGKNPDAIQQTWERIYSEWMPSTKYEVMPDYCIKNYLPGDSSSKEYISEIWLPIKTRG